MEIEIITTKKKLTKSILKQMYGLYYELFDKAVPLGFIRSIFRSGSMHILCRVEDKYYLISGFWEKRGTGDRIYAGYNLSGDRGEYIMRVN